MTLYKQSHLDPKMQPDVEAVVSVSLTKDHGKMTMEKNNKSSIVKMTTLVKKDTSISVKKSRVSGFLKTTMKPFLLSDVSEEDGLQFVKANHVSALDISVNRRAKAKDEKEEVEVDPPPHPKAVANAIVDALEAREKER